MRLLDRLIYWLGYMRLPKTGTLLMWHDPSGNRLQIHFPQDVSLEVTSTASGRRAHLEWEWPSPWTTMNKKPMDLARYMAAVQPGRGSEYE